MTRDHDNGRPMALGQAASWHEPIKGTAIQTSVVHGQPILPVLIRVKKHLNRTHDSEADKAEDQLKKHVPRLMQLVRKDLHNRHREESARRQCLP